MMVKDLFVFLQGLFEIVSFTYRSQTRIAAPTSMLMILRNYLNSQRTFYSISTIKSKSGEDEEERNRFQTDDFTRGDCLLHLVSSKGTNPKYI